MIEVSHILLILLVCYLVYERVYSHIMVRYLRLYLLPVALHYNVADVPVKPRYFGAVTYEKSRITICVKGRYSLPRLAYVLLHEYAHVITVSVGHTPEFWANLDDMLKTAKDMKIYIDEYFKSHPYCRI